MTQLIPDNKQVQRMHFDLSERLPIQVYEIQKTKKQSAFFDVHYALELGILLSGRMVRVYGDYEMEIGPGDIWLCGMWEPHGYYLAAPSSRQIICTIWPGFLAQTFFIEAEDINWLAPFNASPVDRPRVSKNRHGRVIKLGERFLSVLRDAPAQQRAWFRLLLLETLLELTRDWVATPRQTQVGTNAYALLNQAIEMVFSRRNLVTVEEAAAVCYMNRNRFSQLFREVMGIRFSEFVLRHRLSGATRQLTETQDPIKAIALNWGFTDDSHLHRVFKKHYGLSPSEYRGHFLE